MRVIQLLALFITGLLLTLSGAHAAPLAEAQRQGGIDTVDASAYGPYEKGLSSPKVMLEAIALPPPITALDLGVTTTAGSTCQVANPLPEPVELPSGSTSFAFQLTRSVPSSANISISISPSFGGPVRSTNCNGYVVINGQLYQNKLGAKVELLDGSPLPAGGYKLLIGVNGVITEVPFTILSVTLPASTISGTVRDAIGKPIAGAEVSATPVGGSQSPISAQTATDGSYSLEVPAGAYSVMATKAGYTSAQPLNVTVPPDAADTNFTLTVIASIYTISGTVRDTVGSPIAGAEVSATPVGGSQSPISAQTATDGSYSLEVPAGTYSVRATKVGYTSAQQLTVTVPPAHSGTDLIISVASTSPFSRVYLPFLRK